MPELPERWPCCGRRKLGLQEFLSAESVNKLLANAAQCFSTVYMHYCEIQIHKTLTLLYSNKRLTLFETP
jgi:hypothetical protein